MAGLLVMCIVNSGRAKGYHVCSEWYQGVAGLIVIMCRVLSIQNPKAMSTLSGVLGGQAVVPDHNR